MVKDPNQIIKELKAQNHIAGLLGHSYGGMLVNEYINKYGAPSVDALFIANSKVDVRSIDILNETKVVTTHSKLNSIFKNMQIYYTAQKWPQSKIDNEINWWRVFTVGIVEPVNQDYKQFLPIMIYLMYILLQLKQIQILTQFQLRKKTSLKLKTLSW